eukprot:EG_transcript_36252
MVANLPMRDLRGPEGRPAPSVAVVHNPYAFRGYDLVLVPDRGPTPPERSSHPGGQCPRPLSAAASNPAQPIQDGPPTVDDPHRSPPPSEPNNACAVAPEAVPNAANHAAPPAPPAVRARPLQWRRYGVAVPTAQALKDLQTFTQQYPVLAEPRVVRVGPAPPAPEVAPGPQ